MFYSTQVLARKGPLGVVWLAAHMDSKLKKNSVFEANLVGSVGASFPLRMFKYTKHLKLALSRFFYKRLYRLLTSKRMY